MPSIGEIRVDFLADVTQFVSGMNKASSGVSRWANDVAKHIKTVETTMKNIGAGMTIKVTAPIVAFGYASVKAADTSGKAMAAMTAQAERAQKSLAPVGRELIRAFETAQPTIDRVISGAETLFKRFEALPAPIKNTAIASVALVAAIGPAALGVSALAKLAGTAWMPLKLTINAVTGLTAGATTLTAAMNTGKVAAWFAEFQKGHPALFMTAKGMAAIAVAAAAFEAGSWLGKQPFILNANVFLIESLSSAYRNFFNFIEERLLRMKGTILKTFGDMVSSVAATTKKLSFLDPTGMMNAGLSVAQTAGSAMSASGQQDLTKSYMMRFKYLQDHLSRIAPSLNNIISGPMFGPGLGASMRDDWQFIMDALDKISKGGPTAADESSKAWKEWHGNIVATGKGLQEVAKQAAALNEKYTPEIVKLQRQLNDLDMMRVEGVVGPDKAISMENWKRARADVLSQIEAINREASALAAKPYTDSFKAYQTAVDAMSKEYLSAYPEVAFNQDIQRLTDLIKKFNELGDVASAGMAQAVIDAKVDAHLKDYQSRVKQAFDQMAKDSQKFHDEQRAAYDKTFGARMAASIEGFAATFSQAVANMRRQGMDAFDDLAGSFLDMIVAMSAQEAAMPLFKWLGGAIGSRPPGDLPLNYTPINDPNVRPFASGGITGRPIFAAGEAGREVIAPLTQLPGLLSGMGMGGAMVQIIDQRGSGSPIQVRESRAPDGRRIITAIVKDAMAGGELDSAMSQRFNVRSNPR